MMKKIKSFLLKVQDEFKGVSKGALATVMIVETVVCLILGIATLSAGINTMAATELADNAVDTNTEMKQQINDLKTDLDSYRQLYKEAKQEIAELKGDYD